MKKRKRGPCCSGMKRIKIVWQVRDVGLWDIYEQCEPGAVPLSLRVWTKGVCRVRLRWGIGRACVDVRQREVWGRSVCVCVCVRRVWMGMWMDWWRVVAVSLHNFHLLVLKFPWNQFYCRQQPWAYRADIKQPLQSNILPVCKLHLKLGEKRPRNGFVRKEKKKKRKPQWSFKLVWINL